MSNASYDFIIVGAGPAGCALAHRLSDTPSKPSVLLLEAGGTNEGIDHLSGAERYQIAFRPPTANEDGTVTPNPLNWSYKTEPQVNGQRIDYSRGKGLGGTTAINFCGWVVGPDDDYDEWARLVDNDKFAWNNVKRVFREKVETFHNDVPEGYRKWFKPKPEEHGTTGVVDVSHQDNWFPICHDIFTAAQETASFHGINEDVNNGDPIGMGIGTLCVHNGRRITAASAYGLYSQQRPANFEIVVDELIEKVIVQDGISVAVKSVSGKEWKANKDIIISGGTINTIQLLLLSGIGPKEGVEKHGIKLVSELPLVGQTLQDHCFATTGIVIKKKPGSDNSGSKGFPTPMGWFKLPAVHSSKEFSELPKDTRDYLEKDHVPNWEIAAPRVQLTPFQDSEPLGNDEEVFSTMAIFQHPQSRGTVTLQSSDPRQPPLMDPKYLSHPYDKRNAIEALREMLRFQAAPTWKQRGIVRTLAWPRGVTPDSNIDEITDEALWEVIQSRLGGSWHMGGSCRMGKQGASREDACVDSSFRVIGIKNLRVADMSVVPRLPNNHPQTTAYVIGELAAEQVILDHGL